MGGLTAIVVEKEAIFFVAFSENTEADCLLKSLIKNSKTETSQQGKERNWAEEE